MLSTTAATVYYAATSMRVDSEAAENAFLTPVAFIVSIELLCHNFFFCFEVPPLGVWGLGSPSIAAIFSTFLSARFDSI